MQEHVELFMVGGNHNKVYEVWLAPIGWYASGYLDGWVVRFAYGRIGSTLKHGTKTETPLPYYDAKQIYDNLVQSKLVKGYKYAVIEPKPTKPQTQPKPQSRPVTVTVTVVDEPRGRKFRDV